MGGTEMSALDGLVAIVHRRSIRDRCARSHSAWRADGATIAILDPRHRRGRPPRSRPSPRDVSDRASVDAAVAAVAERFGRIDIVVNNAGIGAQGDVAANDDDEWGARALDQRDRHRPRDGGGIALAAEVACGGGLQHGIHRLHHRTPAAGAVQRVEGGRLGADPRDGGRPPARGYPG